MHFRQKKICGSSRAKQRQQKAVLPYKALWRADQEGKGEIYVLLRCCYIDLFNWEKCDLVGTFRHEKSSISRFIYIPFCLLVVWRGSPTKPEVLRDDPRLQRDPGNNPHVNYWPGKFWTRKQRALYEAVCWCAIIAHTYDTCCVFTGWTSQDLCVRSQAAL